jgi:F-type H+-transporting ATPase subunit epsilon
MFDKPFNIEIVTPRKVIFSGEVNSFSAPGIEGGFQVLFSHAPFL